MATALADPPVTVVGRHMRLHGDGPPCPGGRLGRAVSPRACLPATPSPPEGGAGLAGLSLFWPLPHRCGSTRPTSTLPLPCLGGHGRHRPPSQSVRGPCSPWALAHVNCRRLCHEASTPRGRLIGSSCLVHVGGRDPRLRNRGSYPPPTNSLSSGRGLRSLAPTYECAP